MNPEKKIISEYSKINDKRHQAFKDFIKNLITIGTGFLALFIGLKADNIESTDAKLAFLITIILIVVGILTLVISLYNEIYTIDKHQTFLKKTMEDIIDGGPKIDRLNVVNKPMFFKICEFVGFTCFIFSSISLIYYVYLLEF